MIRIVTMMLGSIMGLSVIEIIGDPGNLFVAPDFAILEWRGQSRSSWHTDGTRRANR